MYFHAYEKTPRILAPRADGACPFCITQLHEDAWVCCGCGAHKRYYRSIYLPNMAELRFSLFIVVFVVGFTYYAPFVLLRMEKMVKDPSVIDLLWWPMVFVIVIFWIALIRNVNWFIRSVRHSIDGVVWRRKRWG